MKHRPLRFDAQRLGEKGATVNKLVPLGTYHRADFPGGRIVIDRKYLETMVANWKASGSKDLPIDYFHRGDSENDGLPVSDKVAAGWLSNLEVRADGLYGETKWNPKAKAHIEAEELKYFSPTWHPNGVNTATGERCGPTLLGGALLNDPYFKELPALAATDSNPTKGNTMELLKLAALLAISADTATEATIEARLKVLVDGEKKALEAADKLKAADTIKAELKAATEENGKMAARLAALEKEAHGVKLVSLTDKLLATGRKVEKERAEKLVAALGWEEAEKTMMSFAPAVDLKERGVRGTEGAPEHDTLLATFNAKLDELIKAGAKFYDADKQLRKDPQFAPLFNLSSISAPRA